MTEDAKQEVKTMQACESTVGCIAGISFVDSGMRWAAVAEVLHLDGEAPQSLERQTYQSEAVSLGEPLSKPISRRRFR